MCGSVTGIYKTITILLSVLIKVKKSHIMRIGGGFMLVRFSVENFLSFKNLTEFSMVAGKMTRHSGHIAVCNHKRLLKAPLFLAQTPAGKRI